MNTWLCPYNQSIYEYVYSHLYLCMCMCMYVCVCVILDTEKKLSVLRECLHMLSMGARANEGSAFIHIERALFYFFYLRFDFLGYASLSDALRRLHKFDFEVLIARLETSSKLSILEAHTNRDVVAYNEYDHQRRVARNHVADGGSARRALVLDSSNF